MYVAWRRYASETHMPTNAVLCERRQLVCARCPRRAPRVSCSAHGIRADLPRFHFLGVVFVFFKLIAAGGRSVG